MRFFLGIFLLLSITQVHGSEFVLSAGHAWTRTNISGQNNLPLYIGTGFSADLEYLIPFGDENSISIFATLLKTNQNNTANGTVAENLGIEYLGAGLKLSIDSLFFSASLGKLGFEDKVTGTVIKTIKADTLGYEIGLGYRYPLTRLLGVTVGFHGMHSSFIPSDGTSTYSKYGLWQLRGTLGLTFILPSLPTGEFSL